MNAPLTGISSMATRQVLAELTGAYTARTGQAVAIESVGGVDAAKRVAAGEAFDVVILASDAIDKLIAAGHLQAGRVDLVRSGVALRKLFERWGIAEAMAAKTVQAPPGVPVASLVAKGEVALGFQQLSELLHVPGIAIVGGLPEPIQIVTVFSAGIPVNAPRAETVRALLAFMTSPDAAEAKRRQGMSPA